MSGISRSARRHTHRTVAVAAVLALAACGSDAPPTGSTATTATTEPAATTTEATSPDATTTTVLDGPTPIPTDPADLPACDEVDPGQPALMPSRRWTDLADGWQVRYAYTTRPEGEAGAPSSWSTLVRVGADERVTGLLVVAGGPTPAGATPNTTVRAQPAWLGPETTRGGATGALQAQWSEGDRAFVATSRGVDEAGLHALLEDLAIEDGTPTGGPDGWRFLGSGQADGTQSVTVLGITPPDADLLETSYAPVEVTVQERTVGADASGAIQVPGGIDVTGLDVRLRDLDGRPALVTQVEGGQRLVHTTTTDGDAVAVSGSAPEADLLAIASGATRIEPDDERLVGVPIGNVGSSPGRWCR